MVIEEKASFYPKYVDLKAREETDNNIPAFSFLKCNYNHARRNYTETEIKEKLENRYESFNLPHRL